MSLQTTEGVMAEQDSKKKATQEEGQKKEEEQKPSSPEQAVLDSDRETLWITLD